MPSTNSAQPHATTSTSTGINSPTTTRTRPLSAASSSVVGVYGFDEYQLRTALKILHTRIYLLDDKRKLSISQLKQQVGLLLHNGAPDAARARTVGLVLETRLLGVHKHILRCAEVIEAQPSKALLADQWSEEMKKAAAVLFFVASRLPDHVPELSMVAAALAYKLGLDFAEKAQMNADNQIPAEIVSAFQACSAEEDACTQMLTKIAARMKLNWDPNTTATTSDDAEAPGASSSDNEVEGGSPNKGRPVSRNGLSTWEVIRGLSPTISPNENIGILHERLRFLESTLPESTGIPITIKSKTIYRNVIPPHAVHRGPPSRRLFPQYPFALPSSSAPPPQAAAKPNAKKVWGASERLQKGPKRGGLPPLEKSKQLSAEQLEDMTRRLYVMALEALAKKKTKQDECIKKHDLPTKQLSHEQLEEAVQRLYARHMEQAANKASKGTAPSSSKSPPLSPVQVKESIQRLYYEKLQHRAQSREQLRSKYLIDPPVVKLTKEQQEEMAVRLSAKPTR